MIIQRKCLKCSDLGKTNYLKNYSLVEINHKFNNTMNKLSTLQNLITFKTLEKRYFIKSLSAKKK